MTLLMETRNTPITAQDEEEAKEEEEVLPESEEEEEGLETGDSEETDGM